MPGKPPPGAIPPMKFFSKLVWLDGRPLLDVIEPYRRKIFNDVLWTFDADGRPKHNLCLTGRAKKEWKTTDLVLAGLYRFTVWPSPWGNSSAIVASDLSQAADDLQLCKKLIDRNPILSNRIEVRVKQVIRKDTLDTLDILPAQETDSLHGKTYNFLGQDEIHTQVDYRMFEALAQDPLRLDTLTWMSSYSPLVARPGIPLVDFLELGKSGEDPRFYLSWYAADWSTDLAFRDTALSPERRANPSWDDDREAYLRQQKRRLPAAQYKRLHLNLPGPAKGAKFDPASVLAAVAKGRKRLAHDETLSYFAAVDMSGGQHDASVLAIGHRDPETGRVVLDLLQVMTAPHIPRDALNRFAETIKSFQVFSVWGDRYGGSNYGHEFSARGIAYHPLVANKSSLYDSLEPVLAGADIELLDIPELIDEAMSLVERNGKTDHPAGLCDDRINAVAAMSYIARHRDFAAPTAYPWIAENAGSGDYTEHLRRDVDHWGRLSNASIGQNDADAFYRGSHAHIREILAARERGE